jgi:hypothetical protein
VEELRGEAEMLKQLDHPYIVKLEDVFTSDTAVYLVMELLHGGDLFDRIVDRGRYDETSSRRVARRILSAVGYLHERHIVHRDLKPENILLEAKDNDFTVKVTDFGLAKKANKDGLRTFCGTPQYERRATSEASNERKGKEGGRSGRVAASEASAKKIWMNYLRQNLITLGANGGTSALVPAPGCPGKEELFPGLAKRLRVCGGSGQAEGLSGGEPTPPSRCASAAGAGKRRGRRGETPRTPPAAGEVAHACAPTNNPPSCSLRSQVLRPRGPPPPQHRRGRRSLRRRGGHVERGRHPVHPAERDASVRRVGELRASASEASTRRGGSMMTY